MTEDGDKSRGPRESLSDKLLFLKAKLETPPKPGHFKDKLNPDPTDPNQKNPRLIPEKDLPVVKEAKEILDRSRESGRIVTKSENPFGNNVDSMLLYVMGDLHTPGGYPEESVESRTPILRALVEAGPRSRESKKRGSDWYHKERPIITFEGSRQMAEAVTADIGRGERAKSVQSNNSAVVILDTGDKTYNEARITDVADSALWFERLRSTLEKHLGGTTVFLSPLKGNHDADQINKGIEGESAERRFFGSQIYFQEIGDNYGLLALNTNFDSAYWHHYYAIQKKSKLSKEEEKVVEQIEKEMALQKKLVKKAMDSGRKLIVAGHQEDLIKRIVPLKNSRVTHILSGHIDPAEVKPLKVKNADGEKIIRVRVGSTIGGMPGWEKEDPENMEPVGYAIEIKTEEDGKDAVTVEQLVIPKAAKDIKYLI